MENTLLNSIRFDLWKFKHYLRYRLQPSMYPKPLQPQPVCQFLTISQGHSAHDCDRMEYFPVCQLLCRYSIMWH